jgi:hypothetical protein
MSRSISSARSAILRRYDRVLLIQPDDHARVAAVLGERALCVPHPVALPAQPVRAGSRVIGYAASQSPANRHGFDWFVDEVWPQLAPHRVELQVAGHLAATLSGRCLPACARAASSPQPDHLWHGVDLAINPVRWGSGLKIKTVEALASGLPLVTTREGARGLEHLAGEAFLMADDPADFAAPACTCSTTRTSAGRWRSQRGAGPMRTCPWRRVTVRSSAGCREIHECAPAGTRKAGTRCAVYSPECDSRHAQCVRPVRTDRPTRKGDSP